MFEKDNCLHCVVDEDIINGMFIIPNTVYTIPLMTFAYKENLEYIEIPDSVTEIGRAAFFCCYNLKYVKLPQNLREIKRETFACCSNLEKIIFPAGLQKIGNRSFEYCNLLKEIILCEDIGKIEAYAFSSCKNLKNIQFVDEDHMNDLKDYNDGYEISLSSGNVEICTHQDFYHYNTFYINKAVKYVLDNVFGDCDSLNLIINTSFFDMDNLAIYQLARRVKSLCIYDTILNSSSNVQSLDNVSNIIRKIRKKELKDKIHLELIKNNLVDKKYLNDSSHDLIISTLVIEFEENGEYDQLKNKLNTYIKSYIEKNKNHILKLTSLTNRQINDILESLTNYEVLDLQINGFNDIANYGNDLQEYSCYIMDYYYEIVSKYNNDIFAMKIDQLLSKINKKNIFKKNIKMDRETIKYLNFFSQYKLGQNEDEIEKLEMLAEVIRIYIIKANKYLNNLLNYECSNSTKNILLQSDNITISQIINDKIISFQNNIATMIEYYKRIRLMIESNNLYNQRLNIASKQLCNINLLESKKEEKNESIDSTTSTLREIIIEDRHKSNKKIEVTDEIMVHLNDEINSIINNTKQK